MYRPEPISSSCLIKEGGRVWYRPGFIPPEKAGELFHKLLQNTSWAQDTIKMYGREIITRRKVAWYGDRPFDYSYSGHSRLALPWTQELLSLRSLAEDACETSFNACLLNLYHDGSEGMGWHSDDERSLDPLAPVASVSFGEARRFLFRLRSNHLVKAEVLLESGSLLLMDAICQQNWQHSLPPASKKKGPRINLTFRRMKDLP